MNRNQGVVEVPPSTTLNDKKRSTVSERRSVLVRFVLLTTALGVAIWGIEQGPWYQNRLYSHMPLKQLLGIVKLKENDPTYLFWFGKRLNDTRQYTPATVVLSRACNLDPNSVRLRSEWTKALLGSGLITGAYNQLKEFVGTHPNLAQAHFLLGRFYYTQRSMMRCKHQMEAAVKLDSSSAESWAYLSAADNALGYSSSAIAAAEKSIALVPQNANYHDALGLIFENNGKSIEAANQYSASLAIAPNEEVPHLSLASIYQLEGKFSKAEIQARSAVKITPTDGNAYLLLGTILRQENNQQESLSFLQKAYSLSTYNPGPAWQLMQAYRALGDNVKAEYWHTVYLPLERLSVATAKAKAAVQRYPEDRKVYRKLASLLAASDNIDESLHYYSISLHLPQDAPQTLEACANGLLQGGHIPESYALASRAVKVAPGSPDAHQILGDVELAMGQSDKAEKEYISVMNWLPSRKPMLLEKVSEYLANARAQKVAQASYTGANAILARGGETQEAAAEALPMVTKATSISANNLNYLHLLMQIQMIVGQQNSAIMTAEKIVVSDPYDAETRALLGTLLAERGSKKDLIEAQKQIEIASSNPSTHPTCLFAAGIVALKQDHLSDAIESLKQSQLLDPSADLTYKYLAEAELKAGDDLESKKNEDVYVERKEFHELITKLHSEPNNQTLRKKISTILSQHPDLQK